MNNLMDRKIKNCTETVQIYPLNSITNSKLPISIIKKTTAGGRRGFDIFKKAIFGESEVGRRQNMFTYW